MFSSSICLRYDIYDILLFHLFLVHEWHWDDSCKTRACLFENECRNVRFHSTYSTGTAAVRSSTPLQKGYHHYWEIEMSTEVYGTDMVGQLSFLSYMWCISF